MEEEDPRDEEEIDEEEQKQALRILAASPTKFCTEVLHFTPFPYQMKMLEDPSKNIVVCAARRIGKSLVMANKALWYAFSHPGTSTLIVASTQRQSMLMFDKLLDYISSAPLLEESVVRKTRTLLSFTNGSRIVALPCGKTGATIRGENAHMIIVDEAAFVPEDVILSVMMPMLATTDGTMIMISTPWDKSHFFFRAFNMPLWSKHRFKTADNPLVKKEYLAQQLEMLGERRFRQEYWAEFVDDESTYFPMNILRPAIHVCQIRDGEQTCKFCSMFGEGTLPKDELYAGYDPGGMTDPAALVVIQKIQKQAINTENEKATEKGVDEQELKPAFRVVLTKTFATDQKKTGSNNEGDVYSKFNVEIADLHKRSPFRRLMVDSTGIGSPIISHCKELGLPVEGMNMHRRNQEEIFSNLRILLERRKLELPDNMNLLSSLNCIVSERNRIGGYIFTHPSGTNDDLAYALALAVWVGGRGAIIIMMKDGPTKKGWQDF
ncbi:MAG: phage terminase large subunit [Nitrososphaerales archaeon]